jgi:hypothetical protein
MSAIQLARYEQPRRFSGRHTIGGHCKHFSDAQQFLEAMFLEISARL